jgi:thiol-disulfide isomerase/thioredoxin
VLSAFISFSATGQEWAKTPESDPTSEVKLKAGDKMPSAELHNMINYPTKTLKFSDHKPKLIILDFWSSDCGPCIKFWPTAIKLQEEFGQDLQFILVNSKENQKQVQRFLERRKRIDGFYMNLPISCRDSTIWKNFDGGILPRYVWLRPDGSVESITDGKNMTRENISKWLTSGPFSMDQVDERKFYDVRPDAPIFVNGNGGERSSDDFLLSSTITKGQTDNYASANIFYYPDAGYSITITNNSIIGLYGTAYNNRLREFDYLDFLPLGRIELIANDTAKYYWGGSLGLNAYNYQLISKRPKTRQELFAIMQQDLQRYFGLDVKWEKRVKKCVVISMYDSSLATRTKSLGFEAKLRGGDLIIDSLNVRTLTTLMEIGTYYYRKARYPIVDETGYKGVITGIREKVNSYDPATLDKIFMKHGLRFKFEMREVDVLVLREPANSN